MMFISLFILGLCLGSFVNAYVWRVRQQSTTKKPHNNLSVFNGRSICPHCNHRLSGRDLVPLMSWLSLRGKCRYCSKSISVQYPIVELSGGMLFVLSYIIWPNALNTSTEYISFMIWLIILTLLLALFIYDLKWFLLPNKMLTPLAIISLIFISVEIFLNPEMNSHLLNLFLSVGIGGGIFYILFQISAGKWIGGGDVKLGWILGLLLASPSKALLYIFLAALIGTFLSLPLLIFKKFDTKTMIPFGPLLIIGFLIAFFYGDSILNWYSSSFLY